MTIGKTIQLLFGADVLSRKQFAARDGLVIRDVASRASAIYG